MLRRSLTVFALLVVLALVMTLGYAMLNQSGPEQALARARTLLGRGAAPEAIRLLHEAQRSLGPSGDIDLLARIVRLRYRAHLSVDNYDRALRDVRWLMDSLDEVDAELRQDHILLLVLDERTDAAVQAAAAFVASAPRDAAAHELAGRALQQRYEKALDRLLDEKLRGLLSANQVERARTALLGCIHREANDGVGRAHEAELRELLEAQVPDRTTFEELLATIAALREDVLASRRHFGQALEGSTARYLALQSYTEQLRRAGRAGDAALIAWLYMQRSSEGAADPVQPVVFEAPAREEKPQAEDATRAPLPLHARARVVGVLSAIRAFEELGLPRFVAEAGELWLGTGGPDPQLAAYGEHESLERPLEALIAICRALLELGRQDELAALVGEMERFQARTERWLGAPLFFAIGLRCLGLDDLAGAEHFMALYQKHGFRGEPEHGAPDLWAESMRIRVRAARSMERHEKLEELYGAWIEARPRDSSVRLERARLRLEAGEMVLAAGDAERLVQVPGEHREEALALLLRAKDLQYGQTGRDSLRVFERLVFEETKVPRSVAHPVIHLGVAGYAMTMRGVKPGVLEIAERNARLALESYPWSQSARWIVATCRLLDGDAEQAAHEAQALLDEDPDDLPALDLRLRALRAAGAQEHEIERAALDLMRRYPGLPASALAFAQALLRRGEYEAALLLTRNSPAASDAGAQDEFRWIALRAQRGLGQHDACSALALEMPADFAELDEALELGLEAAILGRLEDRVDQLVTRQIEIARSGAPLLRSAERLAERGLVAPALRLVEAVHGGGERFRDARTGRLYLLWAQLRLSRSEDPAEDRIARGYLEAAYSFEDGDRALPLLLAQSLLAGDEEEARMLRAQVRVLAAPAGLRAFVHASLEEWNAAGEALAATQLPVARFEAALPMALTLARAQQEASTTAAREGGAEPAAGPVPGPAPGTGWPGLDALVRAAPQDVLDALLLSCDPAFGQPALAAAERVTAVTVPFDVGAAAAGWRALLRGCVLEQLGRQHEALAVYRQLTADFGSFAPAYRELFRLGRRLDPELLASPELVARYAAFVNANLIAYEPEVFVMFCQVSARIAAGGGHLEEAEKLLEAAKQVAPRNEALLRMQFRRRLSLGDVEAALEIASELLPLENLGEEHRREAQQLAFQGAYDSLRELGPGAPESERRELLLDWIGRAERHLETDPAPLAHALALRLQALPFAPLLDRDGDPVAQPARTLCARWAESFTQSRQRRVDEQALARVFATWMERDEPAFVRERLERVLARDPSLLPLWLLHAEFEEREGRLGQAIRDLDWLRELRPVPALLAELGRLYAQAPDPDGAHRYATDRAELAGKLAQFSDTASEVALGMLRYRQGLPAQALELLLPHAEDGHVLARCFADRARLLLRERSEYPELAVRLEQEDREGPCRAGPLLATQLRLLLAEEGGAAPGR